MALVDYGGSDDERMDEAERPFDPRDAFGLQTIASAPVAGPSRAIVTTASAAPDVLAQDLMNSRSTALIPHGANEIMVNLTADQMAMPVQGPVNPFSERRLERMNTVNGFVEEHAMSAKDFEEQQRSFDFQGYAYNPSNVVGVDPETGAPLQQFVGDADKAMANGGSLIQRVTRKETKAMKRKRKHKGTLGVVELEAEEEGEEGDPDREREYVGPWAKWEEERLIPTVPIPDEYEEIEKTRFKKPHIDKSKEEIPFGAETSIFHGKEMRDYQGRTYMSVPRDVEVDLEPEEPGQQDCYAPKKCIHTWSGHQKGVSTIKLFPGSGHLLLSGSMDSNVKLWDIYHEGKCLRTFKGHIRAIRDVCFTNDGRHFLTASFDGSIKHWDTETGACLNAYDMHEKVPNCVKFNPDADKQNIFLAGMSDRKIVQYDMNSGQLVQEYNEHLGSVNTITFCDENRRFVTTSDDKTIRVWDYDIPVVVKYIADPSMHSMPAAAINPDGKWIGLQSLDNQIALFSTETFRANRKKAFRGYAAGGYACQPAFSPDGKIISTGDSGGRIHFWDFKTSRKQMNATIQCHSKVLIQHAWLPHETSKIITASWDGSIKLWD